MTDSATTAPDGTQTAGNGPGGDQRPPGGHISPEEQEALAQPSGLVPLISGTGANPLRDPRDRRIPRVAGPCVLVIFGVTGDLARKKLMPAIYDLAPRGPPPPGFRPGRLPPPRLGGRRLRPGHLPGGEGTCPDPVPGHGLAAGVRGHQVRVRRVHRGRGVRPAPRGGG